MFADSAVVSGDECLNCSLEEMVAVYGDFWRLTRFSLEALPGRIFDRAYADFVAQPERTIRRLLKFCGLLFDSACLAPHQLRAWYRARPVPRK